MSAEDYNTRYYNCERSSTNPAAAQQCLTKLFTDMPQYADRPTYDMNGTARAPYWNKNPEIYTNARSYGLAYKPLSPAPPNSLTTSPNQPANLVNPTTNSTMKNLIPAISNLIKSPSVSSTNVENGTPATLVDDSFLNKKMDTPIGKFPFFVVFGLIGVGGIFLYSRL